MDKFAQVDPAQAKPVPEALYKLFNDPSKVEMQPLPCEISDVGLKAVHFEAGRGRCRTFTRRGSA